MQSKTAQDFGYEVNGKLSVPYTVKQSEPQEFLDSLARVFAHPSVTSLRWEQSIVQDVNTGEMSFEVKFSEVYDHLGITINTPTKPWRYHWSFIDYEASNMHETVYMELLEGIVLDRLPQRFEAFSNTLEGGYHVRFLMESFGMQARVAVFRDGASVKFFMEPLKAWD